MILQKLKRATRTTSGDKVTDAVITVQRTSTTAQRRPPRTPAGSPVSTSCASSTSRPPRRWRTGSTRRRTRPSRCTTSGAALDISILEVGEGVVEVKSTNGDTHLGGDDFDQRIVDWLIAEFRKSDGIDLGKDRVALQRLREAAEKAKIELSSVIETEINLPFVTADAAGPKHLAIELTRAKLESLVEDLVQRTFGPVKQALADAGVEPSDIDEVVLVGGHAHATGPRRGEAVLRQGALTRASTRTKSSADRRGGAGRRARRAR